MPVLVVLVRQYGTGTGTVLSRLFMGLQLYYIVQLYRYGTNTGRGGKEVPTSWTTDTQKLLEDPFLTRAPDGAPLLCCSFRAGRGGPCPMPRAGLRSTHDVYGRVGPPVWLRWGIICKPVPSHVRQSDPYPEQWRMPGTGTGPGTGNGTGPRGGAL